MHPDRKNTIRPIMPAQRLPKVSVIVTTYNQAETLAEALESILGQQTDFDIEIMLSDDQSTDHTPDICRQYASRYPDIVRYHQNPVNLGARDNYFDTLLRCRGEYIADLAGDDRWCDPRKLADQVAALDADPAIVMCHTDWQYLQAETGKLRASRNTPGHPWLRPVIEGIELITPLLNASDQMMVHSCTMVYRADVARDLVTGYPQWFRNPQYPCEDLQLVALLADRGKVAYIDRVTLDYRVGHDQITSIKNPAKAFDFNYGTLLLRLDLQQWLMLPQRLFPENRRMAAFITGLARRAGDRRRAAKIATLCRERHIRLPLRSRLRLWLDHLQTR